MKLSIIVPVYNTELYIRDCLLSISQNRERDFECIIVDDGSTDNSKEVIKEFVKSDSRFKCISTEHKGLSAARNLGISLSTGDWLSFINSDDLVFPWLYTDAFKYLESSKANMFSFCCRNVSDLLELGMEGPSFMGLQSLSDWRFKIFRASSVVMNGNIVRENNIRFDELCDISDYTFLAKVYKFSKTMFCLDRPLYIHRLRKNTLRQPSYEEGRLESLHDSFEKLFLEFKNDEDFFKMKRALIFDYWNNDTYSKFRNDGIDYIIIETIDDSMGNTKSLIENIHTYLPWIRKIHVLLTETYLKPTWDYSDVQIVDVSSLCINGKFPSLKSKQSIENFFSVVPDLSEKFIYGRQDLLYTKVLKPRDFFDTNGKTRASFVEKELETSNSISSMKANGFFLASNYTESQKSSLYRDYGTFPVGFYTDSLDKIHGQCFDIIEKNNLDINFYISKLDRMGLISKRQIIQKYMY